MNRKKLKAFLLILLGVPLFSISQEPEYRQLMNNPQGVQFSLIKQKAEEYYAERDKGRGSGYKQYKRWEYLTEHRLMPDGTVANSAALNWKALNQFKDDLGHQFGDGLILSTNGDWIFNAPTSYTLGFGHNGGLGRVNCIGFHPTNANIFYVGLPDGGLWRTLDAGESWTPLTDGMPNLGVSGIAIDYYNNNIMYILTGDGDGNNTFSIGVMKTTDGGITWLPGGLSFLETSFVRGYKLRMHPTNPNILFAATSDGIWRTSNAGDTWTRVEFGNVFDIEFQPGNPSVMYATSDFNFFRSTNTGENWTLIGPINGLPSGQGRREIAITPANSNYVYLLAGPVTGNGSFKGLYRSTDAGLNFSLRSSTPNILGDQTDGSGNRDQSWYDLAITASRTNAEQILIGGINCWRSLNGGNTWTIVSHWVEKNNTIGYTHADIHALEINPLNSHLFCGSDGGIYRTTDFGADWTNRSFGLGIMQYYRIAGTEANSNLILGGTQDNGTNKWTGGSGVVHVLGADGMECLISHANSNIMYATVQFGTIFKSTNGGTSWGDSINPATGAWVTPMIMDPSNHNILYAGYTNVWKSTNGGGSWSSTSADGRGALAMGTSNTSRIYASSANVIRRSDDAAATWTTKTTGLPTSLNITYIAVNPSNSLHVYITYDGYNSTHKVYSSTNGGDSWTNITGSLPNVPVNCIAYEKESNGGVYVGTDIGVFYRNNNIDDWIYFSNGLPTVRVFELEINKTAGLIRAATFGRGLWTSTLYSACPHGYILTTGNDPSNPNYTGVQYYEASNGISSTRTITGGTGTDVTYMAGNYVWLGTGFHARVNNVFKATLGPCAAIAVTGDEMPEYDKVMVNMELPQDPKLVSEPSHAETPVKHSVSVEAIKLKPASDENN